MHNAKQILWKYKSICILEEITSDQEFFQTARGIRLDFQENLNSDMMVNIWNTLK